MRQELYSSRKHSRSHLLFAAAAAVVAGFANRASAQNFVAGSSWNTAADWNTGHVPGASAVVNIAPSTTNGFTVDYDYNGPALKLNSLTVSTPGFVNFTESLVMDSNSLSAIVEMVGLSTFETGQIIQNGGTNTVNFLELGNAPLSTGTYVLSNTGTLAGTTIFVGGAGSGPEGRGILAVGSGVLNTSSTGTLTVYNTVGTGFTLSGGVVSVGALNLSGNTNLLHWIGGTLNFINPNVNPIIDAFANGGNLGAALSLNTGQELTSAGGETVGNGGTATLNQTTGANVVAGSLLLGAAPSNGNGTYNLGGSGYLSAGSESIGAASNTTGFFNQSGGTNSISGALNVGTNSNSAATYILSGGSLGAQTINVGGNNPLSAIMTVLGGTLDTGTAGAINVSNTANTQLNLFSGTINTAALNLNGTPSLFDWTSGTLGLTAGVTLDPLAGLTNTTSAVFGSSLTLFAGQTLNVTSVELLGKSSTFSLAVNGGINNVGALAVNGVNGSSTYTLSNGGSLNATGSGGIVGSEFIASHGAGLFNQSGGTNSSSGDLVIGPGTDTHGTYLLSGGTVSAFNITVGGVQAPLGEAGLNGAGIFNQTGGANVVSSNLNLAYNQESSGTYILSGGMLSAPSIYVGGSSERAGGAGLLTVSNTGHLSNVQLLQVYSGGRANLDVPTTAVGNLAIAGNGIVNLNGQLNINYGSPGNDPVAAIVSYLKSGYNGGAWNGTSGFISTSVTGGAPATALGYADSNTDNLLIFSMTSNQIVVKYTLLGDANLDGNVNFNDLVAVVQNFNKAGTDWAHGNFGYGASTNFQDLVAVIQNFNKVLPPPSGSAIELGGGSTFLTADTIIPLGSSSSIQSTDVQLPEPGAMALAAFAAAGVLKRRRKPIYSGQYVQITPR